MRQNGFFNQKLLWKTANTPIYRYLTNTFACAVESYASADFSLFSRNKCIPSEALKPVAAKTLNRSTMPKYFAGTIFIPNAPTNIIIKATRAQMPYERQDLSFAPATIIIVKEAIDRTTTIAVIATCITS